MASQTLLQKAEPLAVAPRDESPDLALQIVKLAENKDLDVAKLQALIDMSQQIQKSKAEAAFNQAFAVMQGEIPVIAATKQGDKWKYAPLEDIVEAVRPILKGHGFSLSHRTEWPEKNVVKVVGILSHQLGHVRESEFMSAADGSGSKNAIQGLGSANAYGRRYTTCDLLGIATRDDNGRATSRAEVTDPKGFTEWATDLEAIAQEGTAALQAAWTKSRGDYRRHMTTHYIDRWDALKAKAVKS